MNASKRQRPVSIECARCGAEVAYGGNGRPRKYCSDTCRQRAYELRTASAHLAQGNPMPAVVREVVERVVERDRPAPGPAAPVTVADWIPLIEQLTDKVRNDPRTLVRAPGDWLELALAVRELHDSFTWTDRPPAPTPPDDAPPARQLSRQQRRAQERQRRR